MSVKIVPYSSSLLTTSSPADSNRLTPDHIRAGQIFRLTVGQDIKGAIYPFLSGKVSSIHDVISDVSMALRCIGYAVPSLANHPALAIAGVTTAFSMGTGANTAAVNIQKAIKSLEIDDHKGLAEQILNSVGGIAQAGAGTAYLGVRVASVAGAILAPNAALSNVTNILANTGNVLFAGLFAFLGAAAGLKLYQGAKGRNKLSAQGDCTAQLLYLQKRIEVSGKDALAHLAKKWKDADLVRLIEESELSGKELESLFSISGGREGYIQSLKEVVLQKHLERGAVRKLVKDLKGLRKPTADLETFVRKVYSVENLTRIGLEHEMQKMEKRREAKLSRLIGTVCMDKIRKCDLTNAEQVMSTVHSAMDTKRNMNTALLVASAVGAAAMIAACILTGGVGALVVTGVLLAVSLAFIGIDGYGLHQAMKSGEAGANDKKMLMISSVASFVMMGGAFAITAALSLGVIPLVIAGAIGIIWLGVTLYALYQGKGQAATGSDKTQMLEKEREAERLKELQELYALVMAQERDVSDQVR